VTRNFLLLGSGEFQRWSSEVERRALAKATGDGSVLILPTASASEGDEVFARWGRMGLDHYEELGIPAHLIPLKTRRDAFRDDRVRQDSTGRFAAPFGASGWGSSRTPRLASTGIV
jgi:hypothetical protein